MKIVETLYHLNLNWKKIGLFILCLFFIIFKSSSQEVQDSINLLKAQHEDLPHMGFFDLNIGIDGRYAVGKYQNNFLSDSYIFNSSAIGYTGRTQASFLENFLERKVGKKIKVVDLLASELSLGDFTSGNPNEKSGIWLAYRFEFGTGTILKLNQHHELGINFILLKFSRDRVSPNISGSGIIVKYRFKNWQVEGGVESRRERMFGYLMPKPAQYIFNLKYLIDGNSNFGIRLEELGGERNKLNSGLVEIYQVRTLKIFYGKYF